MAAFEQAVRLGYHYLETDAHVTADGAVLAFHDDHLDRVTDGRGAVADLTYAEVARARIAGVHPIPLLEDVFASWPDIRLNIDAKSQAVVPALARVVGQRRAWDRVCVASFSVRRLRALRRELGPRVASSYGPVGVAGLRLLPGAALRRLLLGPGALAAQVPPRVAPARHPALAGARRQRGPGLEIVTAAFVERAHALGKQVHVWTVDAPEEMERLLGLGVDGIMTDRIDVLRDVFRRRGLWRD